MHNPIASSLCGTKHALADLSEGIQQEETEPEDILEKIDLSGIVDWDPRIPTGDLRPIIGVHFHPLPK